VEREFRGEFRHRVLVAGIITGVLSRVMDWHRVSCYSPRER
jgi:hypothetical protein